MKRIGILSDTHSFLDNLVFKHLEECNEIWHAGDIGSVEVYDELKEFKPLRAVFGNIDNHVIRQCCNETETFECEGAKVLIKHIVGYPGRYDQTIPPLIRIHTPTLLIAGHSHILKVMHDKKNNLLFINPGAAGKSGFHRVRTLIRLTIDSGDFKDLEVIELKKQTS